MSLIDKSINASIIATIWGLMASQAIGAEIRTSENDVVSSSTMPEVLSVNFNDANRNLNLELKYTNNCHAERGTQVDFYQQTNGTLLLTLEQKKSVKGCPDIFSPKIKTTKVKLPRTVGKDGLDIVARFASEPAIQSFSPTKTSSNNTGENGTSGALVRLLPDVANSVSKITLGTTNYTLSADIALAQQCSVASVFPKLFEFSNKAGEPDTQVLILTSLPECIEPTTDNSQPLTLTLPLGPYSKNLYIINQLLTRPLLIR